MALRHGEDPAAVLPLVNGEYPERFESFESFVEFALALPGTSEAEGHFAFSVLNKGKPKGFVWAWNERVEPKKPRVARPDVVAVRVANQVEKQALIASDGDKFFTDDERKALVADSGAGVGDLILIVADKRISVVNKVLGGLRNRLAARYGSIPELDRSDPAAWKFAWIVDFPWFEYNDEDERWDFIHHPFTGITDEPPALWISFAGTQALNYGNVPASRTSRTTVAVVARMAPVDLLLTDVVMPEGSGRELTEELSQERPGLPVVYMSGYSAGVLGPPTLWLGLRVSNGF